MRGSGVGTVRGGGEKSERVERKVRVRGEGVGVRMERNLTTMAFTGRVTLFFASNSETNCRNSMVFQHKASYTPT